MTGHEILAITEPERLFPEDPFAAKAKRNNLLREHHPDNGGSDVVCAHINVLYRKVVEKINNHTYAAPNTLVWRCTDGRRRKLLYRSIRPFELGEMAYADRHIAFVLRGDFADLAVTGVTRMNAFSFRDAAMKKEMMRFLPEYHSRFDTIDGDVVVVLGKAENVFCLRDVLNHYTGRMPGEHVAWILSGLFNIACYLDHIQIAHNDISLDTVFIHPGKHDVMLYGGWWYAQHVGKKFEALPHRTMKACAGYIAGKKATTHIDLALIRRVGLELLGDPSGMALKAPAPLADFLRRSPVTATLDYVEWGKALRAAYGPRKFVEMNIGDVLKP